VIAVPIPTVDSKNVPARHVLFAGDITDNTANDDRSLSTQGAAESPNMTMIAEEIVITPGNKTINNPILVEISVNENQHSDNSDEMSNLVPPEDAPPMLPAYLATNNTSTLFINDTAHRGEYGTSSIYDTADISTGILNSTNDGEMCPLCKTPISGQAYAILKPCNDSICCACLCDILGERSFTSKMTCPKCSKSCIGHKNVRGTAVKYPKPLTTDIYGNPSPIKDPIRFWFKREKLNDRKGKGMIYIIFPDTKDENSMQAFTAFFKAGDGCCTIIDEEKLIRIFLQLRSIIFPVARSGRIETGSVLSPQKLINYANDNNHICLHLLYALGVGRLLDFTERRMLANEANSYKRSDLLAVFAAKELIARCSTNQIMNHQSPSTLQLSLGDILFSFGVPVKIIDLLSRFRITASYNTLRPASSIENTALLKEVPQVSPWDLVVWCYDNLGFTKKVREASKDQWTVLSATIIDKNALEKIGFYKDCSSDRISREGTTLESLVEACKINHECYRSKIIGMKKEDIELLTFYSLCHIETAMKLAVPSVIECRSMLESKKYSSKSTIPCNLGIDIQPRKRYTDDGKRIPFKPRRFDPLQLQTDYEAKRTATDVGLTQDNDSYLSGSTMLAINNMVVDIPFHADIAKDKTIKMYLDHFLNARNEQLKTLVIPPDQEPPVASAIIPVAGDGQPANTMYKLQDKDARESIQNGQERIYKDIRPFVGGFHTTKEVITKMHDIVGELTKCFIKGYRRTTGQQDWILDPHDPRQFEEEVMPYIIAQYRAAAEGYATGNTILSFSPVDVHYMLLHRAQQSPLAMLMLMECRYHEIYLIFRDAERCNASEMFFSGLRLALPLFAATNAQIYVKICTELLIWRETASPAEIAIFEEFAFTRRTVDDKCQYVDLAQEKINGFFRDVIGHNVLPGHSRRMANAAVGLRFLGGKS
jgi:hypothetical protein